MPPYWRFGALSLAHFINDAYAYFLYPALPFFLAKDSINIAQGSLLISAFTITSALVQPFFGYLNDNKGQNWLVYVGTIWMSIFIGLMGVLHSFPLLLAAAGAAGLGTAAFHPQGFSLVARLSNRPGLLVAFFVATGSLGMAASPFLFASWLAAYGLGSTPYLALIGLVAGLALVAALGLPRQGNAPKTEGGAKDSTWQRLRERWVPLLNLLLVVIIRTVVSFGFMALLPLYLKTHGFSPIVSGQYLSVLLFAGVLGGFLGGFLADRLEGKIIIFISLFLAIPCAYLFFHHPVSLAVLALAGFFLMASVPVTMVSAQRLLPKNIALASSLSLGLPMGIGGLGIGTVGFLAQHYGFNLPLNLLTALILPAAILSLWLPNLKQEKVKTA